MGLARIGRVRRTLGLEFACPVITVAGTNGKGSTCALLEAMLGAAGYRVGCHTSPHLLSFNERARIDGKPVDEARLLEHFEAVERARCSAAGVDTEAAGEVQRAADGEGGGAASGTVGDTAGVTSISLTYFEFTTLAIMHLFASAALDVVILEVGLGGRLDAVNIIDADCAVVTSIDIDHAHYLGNTREAIGFEKAGIFRAGRPAICADPVPPASLIDYAEQIGADLRLIGRDFGYETQAGNERQQWRFRGRDSSRPALAYPALRGANQLLNASAALAALEALRERLPMPAQAIRLGLANVTLPGRFQVLPGRPAIVLDVAHNPHAAAALAANLGNMGYFPYTYAVFGVMADKDIDGILAPLQGEIDHWCLTDLPTSRAAHSSALQAILRGRGVTETPAGAAASGASERSVRCFASPQQAYADALERASENDRILVFGSFFTVAGVMERIPGS
ncbi:MAG: bifunctional folylpolyglutamate synthase/dihydrofolate synthase [Janthinobacterium lividum]